MTDGPQAHGSDNPPGTAVQETVLRVVRRLLGRDDIGPTDSFFDFGGNSMLAARLAVELRRTFGVRISERQIFELATVERIALAQTPEGQPLWPEHLPAPAARDRVSVTGELAGSYVFPASFGQQRMWFLTQLDPAVGRAYHLRSALRVDGPLDVELLRRAFDVLVRRHEMLRTRFVLVDADELTIGEQLAQVVAPTARIPVNQLDLTGWPDDLVWQALTADADEPFDLESGPLLRGCVARVGEHRHILQLTMHHIAGDGISMAVLGGELSEAYAALAEGRAPELPELPIQFADFAMWQRDQQDSPEYQEHLAYWRAALAGLAPLDLPTDRPRPPNRSYRGCRVPVRLPAELVDRAAAAGRAEGATLFMVLLAAWQAVLGRFSGSTDFGIGTPIAGRSQPETEPLIGFFVNTVVLRADLSGAPTFQQLVQRTRERAFDAYRHQDVPFEKLVDELAPERDLSRSPLFQVWFAYQDATPGILRLPGATVEQLDVAVTTAAFDLSLVLHREGAEVLGWLQCASDMFEESTARQLAVQWQALLTHGLAEPTAPVATLPLPQAGSGGRVRNRVGDRPDEPGHRAGRPAGAVAAVTPQQDAVLQVVRRLLGRDDIGVTDRFFEFGGNSMLAARLVVELRRVLNVRISVKQIFELATVARIALAQTSDRPVIPPRPPDAEPVLSFDQQRLWLENLLRPQGAYNVHGRRRLIGDLNVAALRRSVAAIRLRHEALRTRFPMVDHRPVQVVDDADDGWRIEFRDLSALNGDRDSAAVRLANAHAATPFDLAEGPLFRCLLVKVGDTDHLLSITAHHIVCDGWSIDLFMRELAELYPVGGDIERATLPTLPIQYLDYAVWQRGWLTGQTLEKHVGYWREQLAGAPPALALPIARRRSANQGAVGGRQRSGLSRAETAALRALCTAHGVTPFMVLLAAMATVLGRWSGQRDVVIGAPIANRHDASTDHLIGLFVNTLPMRVDLSGEPAFTDLLRRVHKLVVDGAVRHGEAPLDAVVRELKLARDPTRRPLFEVCLTMVNASEHGMRLGDLAVEPAAGQPELPSTFDLNLFVQESRGELRFDLTFHADRYDPALIRTFLDQLSRLLGAVAADPIRNILEYPLGDDAGTAPLAAAPERAVRGTDWALDRFDLGGDDRFAVLTGSTAMVASAVRTAGRSGAPVHVPGEMPSVTDLAALVDWLRGAEISVLYLSAPTLRAIATLDPVPPLPALRYGFVANAGDLTVHDVRALSRISASCRMVGLYRLSPSGQPLTVFEVPDTMRAGAAPLRVPLGTEVAGERVDPINAAGLPVATGEVGEICVAGQRTGDFGRRLPDGTLELVHRDGAVHLDTAETVGALRDLPAVRDAVVTEYADTDGPALAAYVAWAHSKPSVAALRQHLVTHVPASLVPRTLLLVDRLPLRPDGEYDLSALPAPVSTPPARAERP